MEWNITNSTTSNPHAIHKNPIPTWWLAKSTILTPIFCYLTISIAISFYRAPKYPTTIPWVGHGQGWFAALRNSISSFTQAKTWMEHGYNTYTKNDKSFVLPGSVGNVAEIIIPRTEMRWMLDQPDSVLSVNAAHYELLHGEYSFVDPIMLREPYHEHVLHKSLARNISGLIPLMNVWIPEDVDLVLDAKPGEWKKVNLMGFFMEFVPRAANRLIIGEPACKNDEYLKAVAGFMSDVVRGMFMFSLFPTVLHPLVGAIAGVIPWYHYRVSSRHSLPIIKQRLNDLERKASGDPSYKTWNEPNDFVTWSIKVARAENKTDELDPSRIAMRVMPLNFAAIHTTSMTSHAFTLDLLSSDPSVLTSLREEASRIYAEDGKRWTKAGLARMYRLDSALRESQRHSSFAQTFVHRKVLAPDGVTKPDGVHCAFGTTLSAPWVEISHDDDLHGGADRYDAFRFSRDREAFEAVPIEERERSESLKVLQSGQVTTSDRHLAFGHGRHACPGRFWVSYLQKMVFAHLILNYEIRHIDERPRGTWINRFFVPPVSAQMEIRKREKMWMVGDA